jgi:hypothetical protein
VTRLLLVVAVLAACSKKEEAGPTSRDPLPAGELKQGRDACSAYADKACACAAKASGTAEHKRQCSEARSFVDAIELVQGIAASPGNKENDLRQQAAAIRATITSCIESTNKLAAQPCN